MRYVDLAGERQYNGEDGYDRVLAGVTVYTADDRELEPDGSLPAVQHLRNRDASTGTHGDPEDAGDMSDGGITGFAQALRAADEGMWDCLERVLSDGGLLALRVDLGEQTRVRYPKVYVASDD